MWFLARGPEGCIWKDNWEVMYWPTFMVNQQMKLQRQNWKYCETTGSHDCSTNRGYLGNVTDLCVHHLFWDVVYWNKNFECIHTTHIKCITWAYSGSPVLILCIVWVHYCLCFYQWNYSHQGLWMNDASSELNTAFASCISVWPLESVL
jgi:hypothetical protein